MEWVKFNVAILLSIFARLALTAPGFFGEFEVTGLEIYSPFQADPKSITNTTVSFVFNDQNTPKSEAARCYLTWAVGLSPPSNFVRGACSDTTVRPRFPNGTYNGVEDFQLEIAHTYIDSSLGPAPWNVNTLFGFLNLTHGTGKITDGYVCDMGPARCRSEPGAMMIANVLFATA